MCYVDYSDSHGDTMPLENSSPPLDPQSLGDQQLEVLRYVTEFAPITVGEVAKAFGASHGLARTTILTVMERLRDKGYLVRRKAGAIYEYMPRLEQHDLMKGLVSDFVQRSLGGSLTPFVAYLAETGKLSTQEISELRKMVENLERQEEAGK